MKTKNRMSQVFVALAAIGVGAVGVAGERTVYRNVTVDTINRSAVGHMSGARNSSDTVQSISCGVQVSAGTGDTQFGYCSAMTTTRVTGHCFTYDPVIIGYIRSLPSDAMVTFVWDTSGRCIHLKTRQSSSFEPKA